MRDAEDDVHRWSEAQLLKAYVENIQQRAALDHIGEINKLMDRRARIVAELESRDESLRALYPMLEHADPLVRYVTALEFRTVDHAAFERTIRPLSERDDEIGQDARSALKLDAHFHDAGGPKRRR